ncbi:hypothetical protein GSI_12165 [Ganoderma sinense ZZ0214-1]|uniref:Uncharacterized protein n=1 Tax=Ganoderma sinense ZZ0214-1 TaxID=1077348 RepID=A0A2G8RY14_9APHY|nr:hypothetical protein GSI_12161 [Ganoderma sinense ZZ0214-1]PIL26406.1 hypothetical protein GSI_12163 [Ganoderma sinense ZZ0214-1]PIL26408.1 hypothetical protein GSI_12165 [Ganoderma sinense ZZ0214-1]
MPTKPKKKKSGKHAKQRDQKCAACARSYTILGYFHHLRQTSKPECIKPFDGDFFGDYDAAEFNDYDEYEGGDEDDREGVEDREEAQDGDDDLEQLELEQEEEEDALRYQEEESWEMDADLSAEDRHQGMDVDPESGVGEDNAPAPELPNIQTSQHRAQDQLRTKTYIDRFPGVHAGAPVHQRRELSAYDKVDADEDNVYFPFQSRIDWEVGRWAKLRGPTSTAVTELLKIKDYPGNIKQVAPN